MFVFKYNILIIQSTEGDSGHSLATLSKVTAVTPKEFSVLVTAERLVNIEGGVAIRDGGPLAITGAVVDRQTEVLDPIFLEVSAFPEPPPDLPAQIVPDCVSAPGVDQVPVTGVQRELALLVQNGVASGVSSDIVTALQLLEARLGHIGSKNFRHFGFISGFLQGVRKSSDPSEMSLGCEIFKENRAFVGMVSGDTLVAALLSRKKLGRGQGHQGRHHGDSHFVSWSESCLSLCSELWSHQKIPH